MEYLKEKKGKLRHLKNYPKIEENKEKYKVYII